MASWWEIISVFLLATVKFVFGAVPMALGMGFSFFQAVTITSLGGFTGVMIFTFTSEKLIHGYQERRHREKHERQQQKKKPVFTRRNRLIMRVKSRFGLFGIALLTPLLFSIPIGCFIAVRYFKQKQKILLYMFASILFWSVSISSFKLFFH